MGLSAKLMTKYQACGSGKWKEKQFVMDLVRGIQGWEWQTSDADLFFFKQVLSSEEGLLRFLCEKVQRSFRLEDRVIYVGDKAYKYVHRVGPQGVQELVVVTAEKRGGGVSSPQWMVTQKEVLYFSSRKSFVEEDGFLLEENPSPPRLPPSSHWWIYQKEVDCADGGGGQAQKNRSMIEQKIMDWDVSQGEFF
jgi:hypothetical protein